MSDTLPELEAPETTEQTADLADLVPDQEEKADAEVQVEETEEIEEEEEKKEEEVEEEEEEEEEQLPSKYHRPVFSEIKKEFPEFFKKFPDMREVYYRESKYSTIFPTVEDAEEAFAKSESFDAIDTDLQSGSTKALLDTLFQVNPKAGEKVAENFLPEIYRKSPDLYFSVVSPLIEGFVKNLYNEGVKTNNESLKAAAMYAAQFGWGHTDVDKLGNQRQVDPRVEEERKKLETERLRIEESHYKEAYGAVAARSQKLLLTEIARQVGGIDDEYKRTNAVRDIFEKINEVLTADTRHIKLMNSLWVKARKSGFSPESRNRLVSTLLARAKQVMPAISRDIMAQINKPKVEKKVVKKSDAGGKVNPEQKAAAPPQNNQSRGRVDWSKYKSGTDFLNAFIENKGKVERT